MQGWSQSTRKKHESRIEKKHELDLERAKELYDTEATEVERYRFVDFVHLLMRRMDLSQTYSRKVAEWFEREYNVSFVRRKGLVRPPRSQEFREHMRQIKLGKPNVLTPEGRASISESSRTRQLGQKYELSANGKKLGKKHLSDPNAPMNISTYIPSKIINAEIEV